MSEHTKESWVAVCIGTAAINGEYTGIYEIQTADRSRCVAAHVAECDAPVLAAAPVLLKLVMDAVEDETELETEWNKAARAAIASARGK